MANGFWDRLYDDIFSKEGFLKNNTRRRLTDEDHDMWQEAATLREMDPPPPRTIEEVRAKLKASNPVRWWYLKRDFAWAKRQMKKLGLNPEDARWLL